MSDWTPPPVGAPCWIQIFATDVQRARKFYEEVFSWKIRESPDSPHMIHFQFPGGSSSLGGGITRVAEPEFIKNKGKGGVALYITVDDLKAYGEKIVKAGGTKLSEIEPQGKNAIMQQFEDTEGNYFGCHEWQGNK